MNDRNNDNKHSSFDIEHLINRIKQLELENERVSSELESIKQQIGNSSSATNIEERRAHSRRHSTSTSTYLNIPAENLSSSARARLSKQERESRSILPLSGKVAKDSTGRRIKIGDRVKSKTKGEFTSRYGIVTEIGSERSDRIFFKDEDGYI